MEQFTPPQKKDLKVLITFVGLYCRSRHQDRHRAAAYVGEIVKDAPHLCADCRELLDYALEKRRRCPLDPKPSCKHCHIHCYSSDYRARVREIMAFSGRRMILRGRIDYLWHYLF